MNKSGLDLLREVTVTLSVELGRCNIKLKEALALGEDSVVQLDKLTDELLDVFVNGKAIAKGEIVAQGDRFALRIVQMCGEEEEEVNPLAAIAPMPRPRQAAPAGYAPMDAAPVASAPMETPVAEAAPPPPPPPPPAEEAPKLSTAEMAALAAAELGFDTPSSAAGSEEGSSQ